MIKKLLEKINTGYLQCSVRPFGSGSIDVFWGTRKVGLGPDF